MKKLNLPTPTGPAVARAIKLAQGAQDGHYGVPAAITDALSRLQALQAQQAGWSGRLHALRGGGAEGLQTLIDAMLAGTDPGSELVEQVRRDREEAASLTVLIEAARFAMQRVETRLEGASYDSTALAPLLDQALHETLAIVHKAAPALQGQPVEDPEAMIGRGKAGDAYIRVRAAFDRYRAIRDAQFTVSRGQAHDDGTFGVFRHPERRPAGAKLPEAPVPRMLAIAGEDREDGAQPWVGTGAERNALALEARDERLALRRPGDVIGAVVAH